jgi:hypothetical protein
MRCLASSDRGMVTPPFMTDLVSHYYICPVQDRQVFNGEKSVQTTNHLIERHKVVSESAGS